MAESNEKLEGKIDGLVTAFNTLNTGVAVLGANYNNSCKKIDDLLDIAQSNQKRIGRLENWRNWIVGAGSVTSVGIGYIARLVIDHLSKHPQ
jgi:hypothetical protein